MSTAKMKNISISPQKMRPLARKVRGLNIQKALDTLTFSKKKCAFFIKKILNSAIANAEHNDGKDIDELVIKKVIINEAPSLKRVKARAKGKANRIIKRYSHVSIELQTNTEFMETKKKLVKIKNRENKIKEGGNGTKG